MTDVKMVEIYCRLVAETDLAICITDDDETDYWIPKSQIDDETEIMPVDGTMTLVIPEWLVEKKGLI